MLGIQPNSVLNTTLLGQKLQEIEKLYLQQGYLLYSVPDIQVTPDGILKIDIAEGIVEDITIEGNEKTKDYVILRELRYKKDNPSISLRQAGVWNGCIIWDFLKMSI